ncbi:hypothetical protein ACIPX0_27810 [Streptomyces sp. NPDC090075]|uniref:hypothetical protein n=1 Tax=Streptomyces sp. NPDC090075 TaxID=3365937 RepID=UPI003822EC53
MSIYGTTWGTFQSLKGSLADDPAVCSTADRRLFVIAQGGSNTLWYTWQGRDLSWNTWKQLPGAQVTGVPAAILGADGLVRVYWRSPSAELFTAQFDNIIGTFGQAPTRLTTGIAGNPAAALNADGRVSVVYRGSDNAAWYLSHTSVAYTAYTPSGTSLGGIVKGTPAVELSGGGRLRVFVRGTDDNLYESVQQTTNSTTYSAFSQIATGMTSDPKAAKDADKRIRVFWRGTNAATAFIGHQANYVGWNPVGNAGGQLAAECVPQPILAIDGRVETFVRGADNAAWGTEQRAVNDDTFTTYASLRGVITGNAIPALHQDGRTAVFVRGSDTAIWYASQTWT